MTQWERNSVTWVTAAVGTFQTLQAVGEIVQHRTLRNSGRADGVVCVIVTHDRPVYLRACLSAVYAQTTAPGTILVILLGLFCAVVPTSPTERAYPFRNRAFIFRRYRMWMFLAADLIRCASDFLATERGNFRGLLHWMQLTVSGLNGRFVQPDRGAENCHTTPRTF